VNPRLVAAWFAMLRQLGPDVVHSHSLKTDVLSAPLCRMLSLPLVIEVHGYLRPDDLRVRVYERLDRLSLRLASAVLTLSGDYRAEVIASGVSPTRTHLLPSGIDIARLRGQVGQRDLRSTLCKDAEIVIGMVARLSPEKGHAHFLSAMSSLKKQGLPVRGLLFGEGPLADELQARIDQEQLNVTLAGYVEQVADAYRSLDVLVSCSHNEGLPLNLIEAMALGVPVVTMATGGCREIVEEGVTGLVVPQGDQVALNRALLSLVGDETQRRQFGQAALRVAEKRFSLEAWAQGAESVYAAVQRQPRDG
jgi:glycosyltransferase involved in cell wall biosynthesis